MSEVRAAYLQLILRRCGRMPDGAGDRIVARIPAAHLDHIRGAGLGETAGPGAVTSRPRRLPADSRPPVV